MLVVCLTSFKNIVILLHKISQVIYRVKHLHCLLFQLQIIGYNADLYDNYTVALTSPHGIVMVAVMLQIGQVSFL
jgi:hypothetical protein